MQQEAPNDKQFNCADVHRFGGYSAAPKPRICNGMQVTNYKIRSGGRIS
jgi:hypothetical protein